MKRTVLRIAIFGFLFAGLSLLGASHQLQAQQELNNDLFAPPTGQFVSPFEAQLRLDGEINILKLSMANLQEGTPEHRAVWLRYTYNNEVLNFIVNGKTIPESIAEGLLLMNVDEYDVPKGGLQSYRNAIINMLKL
jgi:hypothetical protein